MRSKPPQSAFRSKCTSDLLTATLGASLKYTAKTFRGHLLWASLLLANLLLVSLFHSTVLRRSVLHCRVLRHRQIMQLLLKKVGPGFYLLYMSSTNSQQNRVSLHRRSK